MKEHWPCQSCVVRIKEHNKLVVINRSPMIGVSFHYTRTYYVYVCIAFVHVYASTIFCYLKKKIKSSSCQVSSGIEPHTPHGGSTGGVGGIIGVAVLELVQAWNFLRCPQWEAVKLAAVIMFISFLGTFYLISVASFLTGIVVGMLGCLMVVPYITCGHRSRHKPLRLALVSFVLIILTLCTLQVFNQFLYYCTVCVTLECIPYVTGMCRSYYQNIEKFNT